MDFWTILVVIVTGLLGVHYLLRNFNYFKRNGILHVSSLPILGNMAPVVFRQRSLVDHVRKLYNSKPGAKYVRFHFMTHPVILLRDPELIKKVFIEKFDLFLHRDGFDKLDDSLFLRNLSALRGQEWRDVKSLLRSAFTPNKIKIMYTSMTEYAMDFAKSLSKISADEKETNVTDIFLKYTNDVIAACAFGIKVNSTSNFYFHAKELTGFIRNNPFKFLLYRAFPVLFKFFGLKLISNDSNIFFKNTIKDIITTRDAENITHPDMIQLMMDNRGKCEGKRELCIDDMVAQTFLVFFTGCEIVSTVMSYVAYELAAYPDVQGKLHQEIDDVLEKSTGEIAYEEINRLEVLDAVINEVLRLHPPGHVAERICEGTYELPPALPTEKSVVLKKGQVIWFPIYAIHRDEAYYDEPEKFKPERFLDKNVYRNSLCYAPFGLGPRMCLGNKLALLEIKTLIFHLLARCELKLCAKTTFPVKLSAKRLDMLPEGGIWLNIQRRKNVHSEVM